jgi:flagellar assembly protein FliH
MTARRSASRNLPRNPVIDATRVDVSVRPARLNQPLRTTSFDPTYTDPHLQDLVRRASEKAREEARAQGYATGWSQGRQAAGERADAESQVKARHTDAERAVAGAQLARLLASLAEATRAARVAVVPEWTEVADVLSAGALQLAAAALDRELRSIDNAVADSVRAALRHLADPGEAVVHLNPSDAAMLNDDETIGVVVMADSTIPAGSLVVLTPAQRLCHDLPAALAAAEAVLRA